MFDPFKDVRVRQAFNYAIDRNIIIHNILSDAWTVATGLVPPNIPEYNPDLKGYDYDPAKAQELMAGAGYPNGDGFPNLEFATLDSTTAEAIAAMLSTNLGINVEIVQPERGDMIDGLWNHDRWQFFFFGWTADSPSASVWTYELLYCDLDSNFSTYCNPEVDNYIDQARSALDFDTAKADWQQAEVLAMDDAAVIPLGYSRYIYLVNPKIAGFAANLFGPMGFDSVTVAQ
jgi:oligopeptide transport system substrate-binding protein